MLRLRIAAGVLSVVVSSSDVCAESSAWLDSQYGRDALPCRSDTLGAISPLKAGEHGEAPALRESVKERRLFVSEVTERLYPAITASYDHQWQSIRSSLGYVSVSDSGDVQPFETYRSKSGVFALEVSQPLIDGRAYGEVGVAAAQLAVAAAELRLKEDENRRDYLKYLAIALSSSRRLHLLRTKRAHLEDLHRKYVSVLTTSEIARDAVQSLRLEILLAKEAELQAQVTQRQAAREAQSVAGVRIPEECQLVRVYPSKGRDGHAMSQSVDDNADVALARATVSLRQAELRKQAKAAWPTLSAFAAATMSTLDSNLSSDKSNTSMIGLRLAWEIMSLPQITKADDRGAVAVDVARESLAHRRKDAKQRARQAAIDVSEYGAALAMLSELQHEAESYAGSLETLFQNAEIDFDRYIRSYSQVTSAKVAEATLSADYLSALGDLLYQTGRSYGQSNDRVALCSTESMAGSEQCPE